MTNKRRRFIKWSGLTSLGMAGGIFNGFSTGVSRSSLIKKKSFSMANNNPANLSIIGLYGEWATGLRKHELPSLSFRRSEWKEVEAWRKIARAKVIERMSIPAIGTTPRVNLLKKYEYDGLQIEEINWQLPYGRPTDAIVLKPANTTEKLPAILAFHDHGGNKYFGTKKITKTSDKQLALMQQHQKEYYEGLAWANELAKKGYVVLVADAFTFASRRVMLQDVLSTYGKAYTKMKRIARMILQPTTGGQANMSM